MRRGFRPCSFRSVRLVPAPFRSIAFCSRRGIESTALVNLSALFACTQATGATGHLVKAYQKAVTDEGFRTFAGDDASWQPADIPDVLVHETVVAWLRNHLPKHPWKQPGSATGAREKFEELVNDFVKHANKHLEVDALCKAMPERLQELVKKKGERLKH